MMLMDIVSFTFTGPDYQSALHGITLNSIFQVLPPVSWPHSYLLFSAREVMQSTPSVHVSVHFYTLYFRSNWPLTLNFCMWVGHDHGSQGIERQGHRSWVRLMQSVWPRSRAVSFLLERQLENCHQIYHIYWPHDLNVGNSHVAECEVKRYQNTTLDTTSSMSMAPIDSWDVIAY